MGLRESNAAPDAQQKKTHKKSVKDCLTEAKGSAAAREATVGEHPGSKLPSSSPVTQNHSWVTEIQGGSATGDAVDARDGNRSRLPRSSRPVRMTVALAPAQLSLVPVRRGAEDDDGR